MLYRTDGGNLFHFHFSSSVVCDHYQEFVYDVTGKQSPGWPQPQTMPSASLLYSVTTGSARLIQVRQLIFKTPAEFFHQPVRLGQRLDHLFQLGHGLLQGLDSRRYLRLVSRAGVVGLVQFQDDELGQGVARLSVFLPD